LHGVRIQVCHDSARVDVREQPSRGGNVRRFGPIAQIDDARQVRCDQVGYRVMTVEEGRRTRALQPVSAKPIVYSFRHSIPSSLEHHAVTHVGKKLCLGAICPCRCAYFFRGVRAVILRP
jgi:hypothetical protein